MLFSHQYSRSFLRFGIGAEPRRDLIAVTPRGFSQFLTGLRRSATCSQFSGYCTMIGLWLIPPQRLCMCFCLGGQTHHNRITALVLRGTVTGNISSPSAYCVWLQRNWAPARAWAPWLIITTNSCFIIFTYLYKKEVFSLKKKVAFCFCVFFLTLLYT